MIKGTFWINNAQDGRTSIGIEDYDVEMFDGMDYEMIYTLDVENLRKFAGKLAETHQGPLEQMIREEFGSHLDRQSISLWMEERGIRYEFFSWLS